MPRKFFERYFSFVSWNTIQPIIDELQKSYSWFERKEAEKSTTWVQPIPCVTIRDYFGRYCAFRRIRNIREDLQAKVSLIIGGHIDRKDGDGTLLQLFEDTIMREVNEETSLSALKAPHPIGLIVDNSSTFASKHVAFLFELEVAESVKPRAPEEFSTRSKFNNHFFNAGELLKFQKLFDPWSRILFEDYIKPPGTRPLGRQRRLSLDG